MSTTTTPYEPLSWVTVEPEGGLTSSFIVVDCKAADCRVSHRTTLLYLPVLCRNPDALRQAVEEHRGCR